MNCISSISSPLPRPLIFQLPTISICIQPQCSNRYLKPDNGQRHLSRLPLSTFTSSNPLRYSRFSVGVASPSNEGAIPVINFEDLIEKDWSFLETDVIDLNEDLKQKKADQIISVADIQETSKILVSIGSEEFVDKLVSASPCQLLLVVHDSLLLLACIKEKYDLVKCWQGELIHVPEKWIPFDVVFLYFLPALPFKLDQIFGALIRRCSPGARIVISHLGGREALDQQRKLSPDVVIADLPDKVTLESVASDHSFKMIEFVDDPGFYLAVLRFKDLGK